MKIVKATKSCRRVTPYKKTKVDKVTEENDFDLMAKIKIEPISPSKPVAFVQPKPEKWEEEQTKVFSEDKGSQDGLLDCWFRKFGCEGQFQDIFERSNHMDKCVYRLCDTESARRRPNCILNGKLVFADEMPEDPEE